MTAAGELKYKVRFFKKAPQDDEGGGVTFVWAEQFERAAKIQPLKGSESVMAQRLQGKQPALIVVRYDSLTRTIRADWRLAEIVDGVAHRYYAIKAPPEDMERERQFITIVAVEGEPDGGLGP